MLPLSKTKRLFALVVLLLIAGIIVLVIFWGNINAQEDEISDIKGKLSEKITDRNQQNELHQLVLSTQGARRKLTQKFIGNNKVANFVRRIEDLGEEANINLKITSIGVNGTQKSKKSVNDNLVLERLNMTLSTTGTWSEIYHFTKLLENIPLYVKVKSLSVSNIGANGKSITIWQGIIKVTAFKLANNSSKYFQNITKQRTNASSSSTVSTTTPKQQNKSQTMESNNSKEQ